MSWWVHDAYQNGGVILLFSWIFWVIFSIVLHELAHGWAAIACGDNTPRELGHMTLNPVVHMGYMALLFFAIAGITWGMMPTDPSRYRRPKRGRMLVSAAGPAMNILLALITLTGFTLWGWAIGTERINPAEQTQANVATFLMIGGILNLMLAAFNLLPVPPLDGSRILSGASRRLDHFFSQPAVQMYGMIVVLVIFFSSLEQPLQRGIAAVAAWYIAWLAGVLAGVA